MKKTLLATIILLAAGTASAQHLPVRILNQEVQRIDSVRITAGCHVTVATDTVDCVRVSVYADSPKQQPDNLFFYTGRTLTVLPAAMSYGITIGSSNKQVAMEYVEADKMNEGAILVDSEPTVQHRYDKLDDRLFYKLMAGWSNWGDGVLKGFGGIDPAVGGGAYSLKWKFHLAGYELGYAFVMHEHWSLGVGLGFRFDHYYFNAPYVYYHSTDDMQGFRSRDVANRGVWQSQVYNINMVFPIQLNLFAKPSHTGLFCQLELLPGLSMPSLPEQTYKSFENGINTTTETSMATWKNYFFTCDLRLSLNWGILGFYIESSLIPMFSHMDTGNGQHINLYPVHIGFSTDLSRLSRE